MLAQYNNNGHTARYVCQAMKSSYGAPFCQSLKARPLDDLIASLVLEAVTPAAIEASVALAENLEAERAALDRHWLQRRERAGYEVERARRQYAAVDPENRLVARTLERAWEAALTEQARLEADHERLKRDNPQAPSAAEIAAIRELTQDLPALWRAQTTTRAERQTIARLLLERVLVEVVGSTEKVRVECHWHGGSRTTHELTRPVARLARLSTYTALTARAADLRREGLDCPKSPISSTRKGGVRPSVGTRSMRRWFIICSSNQAQRPSNIADVRRGSSAGRTNGQFANSPKKLGCLSLPYTPGSRRADCRAAALAPAPCAPNWSWRIPRRSRP